MNILLHRKRHFIAASLLLVCACTAKQLPPYAIYDFENALADGLSGLTTDSNMDLWTIQERRQHLLQIQGGAPFTAKASFPIQGIPKDVDLEAITALGNNQFALGSELDTDERILDSIYLIEVDENVAHVKSTISIPYSHWQIQPKANHGIEALCYAQNKLLVGIESVLEEKGQRYAPLLLYALAEKKAAPLKLKLTTSQGKLSALACRHEETSKSILVFALERHFGIGRLLKFRIDSSLQLSEPELVYDFAPEMSELPNLEGISFGQDGQIHLISDNNFGGISGPTKIITLGNL